nr:MAG: hypothetical protein [Bacteriophage sp.]
MAKTGKGLPRSLQNVDFSVLDIPVAPATTSEVGGVKKAAVVNFPAGLTAAAGGQSAAAPTKSEFDALVAEYNKLRNDVTALRNTVASLVTALKNAGTVS